MRGKSSNPRKTVYQMAYEEMRKMIDQMTDGERLLSQEQLSESLRVSRTVVREVITAIERDGLIVRRQGIGTFVLKKSGFVHTGLEYLRGIPNIISSSGKKVSLDLNDFEILSAEPKVAERLQLRPGEKVIRILRVYTADNAVAAYTGTYIASKRLPGEVEEIFKSLKEDTSRNDTIFSLLDKKFNEPISYAICEIASVVSDAYLAGRLNVSAGKSITLLLEVHYDREDQPLLYSEDYINTDVFKIHILRKKI